MAELLPARRPGPGRGCGRAHGSDRRPARRLAGRACRRPVGSAQGSVAPVRREPVLDREGRCRGVGCRLHDGPARSRTTASGWHRLAGRFGEAEPRLLRPRYAGSVGGAPCSGTVTSGSNSAVSEIRMNGTNIRLLRDRWRHAVSACRSRRSRSRSREFGDGHTPRSSGRGSPARDADADRTAGIDTGLPDHQTGRVAHRRDLL